MSKGLELIKEYKKLICRNCQYKGKENCDVECFSNIIEKELIALEIIKSIRPFIFVKTISGKYCLETIVDEIGLTKYNYELLKEILKWVSKIILKMSY